MKIILGSGSAYRKKALEEMGYDFEVVTADIDERAIRFSDPEELTLSLAHAKAEAIMKKLTEPALLITADQVVVCNGKIREKPLNADEARAYLKSYAKYPAETISAVAVTDTKTKFQASGIDKTQVYFKPIPNKLIEKLISKGKVYKWGGGFAVDDPDLAKYVDRIDGAPDSTNALPKDLTQRLVDKVVKEARIQSEYMR